MCIKLVIISDLVTSLFFSYMLVFTVGLCHVVVRGFVVGSRNVHLSASQICYATYLLVVVLLLCLVYFV